MGCDFLIASERAIFADTHARAGLGQRRIEVMARNRAQIAGGQK